MLHERKYQNNDKKLLVTVHKAQKLEKFNDARNIRKYLYRIMIVIKMFNYQMYFLFKNYPIW